MSKKSEIPFGAQFSPNQVNLPKLLQIIRNNAGDRKKITEAIRDAFFATHSPAQRWKLADNTVLALRAYELLGDDAATPMPLASELLGIGEKHELYERFAEHILLNLKGTALVETLTMMQTAGEEINLHTLGKRLEQRGLHVPRGAVHLSSMRLWLAQAGVFGTSPGGGARSYDVDGERVQQLLGTGLDEIERLTQLNSAQRAFLRALTRIVEPDPLTASKVADLATALYGAEYNYKELPKSVLFPLRDLGYVQVTKTTSGRGAKPYQISRTPKFRQEISEPIIQVAADKSGLVSKDLFERPLSDILADLKSPSTHTKGKALELLAIYLTRLLDLDFRGWLLNSAESNGAEAHAIAEDRRIPRNRWQIQCLDARRCDMGDIARAFGRSVGIKPQVLLAVTLGSFTEQARCYAAKTMQLTNYQVLLVDRRDLTAIASDRKSIQRILSREALKAVVARRGQLALLSPRQYRGVA